LDNFEYLCPHQYLGSYSVEMAAEPFIPISRSLFQSLSLKYGGGPVISSLEICPKCQTHLRAYNDRKQAEFDLVSKYDTKDTGDGRYWYLVDALWVNKWKRYVRAEHANDIREICAPGPITNQKLFDKDNPSKPRNNLRLRIDYIGVNARVWWLFMHVHGGGPALCREELDIYSADCTPETELCLDELRGKGTSDFARRISRQFVDECHGDIDLYERTYVRCEAEPGVSSRSSEVAGANSKDFATSGASRSDSSPDAACEFPELQARIGPPLSSESRGDDRSRAQARYGEFKDVPTDGDKGRAPGEVSSLRGEDTAVVREESRDLQMYEG